MNENLDLTKILKDCPKGAKFYSRCLGSVEFCKITLDNYIEVIGKNGYYIGFKPNGTYQHSEESAEIDLFPSKEQRDWSKWQRPFVDGDVVTCENQIAIFKKYISDYSGLAECYVFLDNNLEMDIDGHYYVTDLATEKEKTKLFKALEDNGYKWDPETKSLEKLIEPKFKVGDRIRKKGECWYGIIKCIGIDNFYSVEYSSGAVSFVNVKYQNEYELVPNKFDPKTLQPFDKVLVRDYNNQKWMACLFSHIENSAYHKFKTVAGLGWYQCIPFNDDTKHLVGKMDKAPEFYKYWEE